MRQYRPTRNIEKSMIEAIRTILSDNDYDNVTVVKSFKEASKVGLDAEQKNAIICIRAGNTVHNPVEVGSFLTQRKPLIIIDLMGTSNGQIRDLKDILCAELKKGINYYEYTITGGETTDATYERTVNNGKLIVDLMDDTEINLSDDKSSLSIEDRYRWRITLHLAKTLLED